MDGGFAIGFVSPSRAGGSNRLIGSIMGKPYANN